MIPASCRPPSSPRTEDPGRRGGVALFHSTLTRAACPGAKSTGVRESSDTPQK